MSFFKIIWIALICWSFLPCANAADDSCKSKIKEDHYLLKGNSLSTPAEKVYNFEKINADIKRQLYDSENFNEKQTTCLNNLFNQGIADSSAYWADRGTKEGCFIDGMVPKSRPKECSELTWSEFKKKRKYLKETQEKHQQILRSVGTRPTSNSPVNCEKSNLPKQKVTTLANSAEDMKTLLCCGKENDKEGAVKAVYPEINHAQCMAKISETDEKMLSVKGMAMCSANIVSSAVKTIWASIKSLFSLPAEAVGMMSAVSELVTSQKARERFVNGIKKATQEFLNSRGITFSKCLNQYEQSMYICEVTGDVVGALVDIGAISKVIKALRYGKAAAEVGNLLSKTTKGQKVLTGLKKAEDVTLLALEKANKAKTIAKTALKTGVKGSAKGAKAFVSAAKMIADDVAFETLLTKEMKIKKKMAEAAKDAKLAAEESAKKSAQSTISGTEKGVAIAAKREIPEIQGSVAREEIKDTDRVIISAKTVSGRPVSADETLIITAKQNGSGSVAQEGMQAAVREVKDQVVPRAARVAREEIKDTDRVIITAKTVSGRPVSADETLVISAKQYGTGSVTQEGMQAGGVAVREAAQVKDQMIPREAIVAKRDTHLSAEEATRVAQLEADRAVAQQIREAAAKKTSIQAEQEAARVAQLEADRAVAQQIREAAAKKTSVQAQQEVTRAAREVEERIPNVPKALEAKPLHLTKKEELQAAKYTEAQAEMRARSAARFESMKVEKERIANAPNEAAEKLAKEEAAINAQKEGQKATEDAWMAHKEEMAKQAKEQAEKKALEVEKQRAAMQKLREDYARGVRDELPKPPHRDPYPSSTIEHMNKNRLADTPKRKAEEAQSLGITDIHEIWDIKYQVPLRKKEMEGVFTKVFGKDTPNAQELRRMLAFNPANGRRTSAGIQEAQKFVSEIEKRGGQSYLRGLHLSNAEIDTLNQMIETFPLYIQHADSKYVPTLARVLRSESSAAGEAATTIEKEVAKSISERAK